ncbi:MAG TPA: hypothetical protein PK699_08240, partial [bacterium]|nr:hypothetical protein [bacterium]
MRSVFNRLDIDISLEPRNIFYREASKFSITISNDSSLPVYWLETISYLPERLVFPYKMGEINRVPSRGKISLSYEIKGLKRGCYEVGPVILQTSDIISGEDLKNTLYPEDRLTVYPKIV